MNLRHDHEALTFDDVLLVPCESDAHPGDVDVTTRLTRRITLPVPLLSAAMDTVTEGPMAIAMARHGGLGVIHRNLSIAEQAEEVDLVKRSESGMITRPITLTPDHPISEAQELMRHYRISGVPIVDDRGRLVGILTNRDLLFERDTDRPCGTVMTREGLVTAPVGTTLADAERLLHQHKIEKLPIVDSQGYLKGLITVKDISKRRAYPHAAKDEHGRLLVAAALGTADALERAAALVDAGAGSICTTRVVTGVGMPQVTAIATCAQAAAEYDIPIIADGGVKYSGDVVKALAVGADAVMLGSMLAGTDESPGDVILYNGERFKEYRGMGSIGAMRSRSSADRYRQERVSEVSKLVPEGIEGRVSYQGPVGTVLYQIVGGLRAGMGYTGAHNLAELRTKPLVRITNAGLFESHPHSVLITQEAPNYQRRDG